MIKNYLKTAWRNIINNKFYSLINVAGLAIGLTAGLLVFLWVRDELSFDAFHHNARNIYRLEISGGAGPNKQIYEHIVAPIGPLAKQELPDVVEQVRIKTDYEFDNAVFKYGDKMFADETVYFVDPSFFSVFDFRIIKGDPTKPFTDDHSVVITRETAGKFFGGENPIGKIITGSDQSLRIVSGVVENFPKNSSMKADMMIPMSAHFSRFRTLGRSLDDNFLIYDYETYLLVKPRSNPLQIAADILKIHLRHKADDTDGEYLMLPLTKMHLHNADMSDKGMAIIRIFSLIGMLILVIASINCINLATARSMVRAKEISMRKIMGASKTQLFIQFIIETTILSCVAAVISLMLVYWLMPTFNRLSGKEMMLNLTDFHIWSTFAMTTMFILLAASIYPAILLSSFAPLKALRGQILIGLRHTISRRILVVTQFAIAIVLICVTLVMAFQLHYVRSKDLGYDKEHVLLFMMLAMEDHYDAAKSELLSMPGIVSVTRAHPNILHLDWITSEVSWKGKDPNQSLPVHAFGADKDFNKFFKMKMVAGQFFTGDFADTGHFVLNQTALRQLGFKDPIGKEFTLMNWKGTIIGVTADFHYASMREPIEPVVFWYHPEHLNRMYVKFDGKDTKKVIAEVGKEFAKYTSDHPFSYTFLDEDYDHLYQTEEKEGSLFTYFAGIALVISCLGLLGLATYSFHTRTKEIGIRKVLGAGEIEIVSLVLGSFLKLVLAAFFIGTPIAWVATNKWLEGFAYRVHLYWWWFAISGILVLGIAILTIGSQALLAAKVNPVKSLRQE